MIIKEVLGTGGWSTLIVIVCWVVTFFISVGLGEFTEKKIREKYSKK
ncbi:MAG: hypothetical protein IKL18_02095 [Oscillospiraceae bacterium]|nr:hypothetical protein [Oscillospiraceae bacterium]